MNMNRNFISLLTVILLGIGLAGCHPKMDTMGVAEKVFIKMVDKTAGKLDLTTEQMAKLEQLKVDIRKNFEEGKVERKDSLAMIREEGLKENPDIPKMTSLLQESLQVETQRINRAFDLMLEYQENLNDHQKKKLGQMISEWVGKWK